VLLLELTLGCFVSALASGRFSMRLIADGAISCAFIPAIEIAAFALVWALRTGRPLPFRRALDHFLSGNAPWLLWLTGVGVLTSLIASHHVEPWLLPVSLSAVVPAAWSIRADVRFFGDVLERSRRQSVGDAAIFRAVAWPAATIYFLGIAIWTELPTFFRSLGL
jgi:hypothetical protein